MKGFTKFVKKHSIVGIAVGLAVGVAAGNVVATIIGGFLDPIIGYLLGGSNLASETWTVVDATVSKPPLIVSWGAIASSFLTLVAVAFILYYGVKVLGLDKADTKAKTKTTTATTKK